MPESIRIAPNPQGSLPRPAYADPQDFGAGVGLALQRVGSQAATEAADAVSEMVRARKAVADQTEKLEVAEQLGSIQTQLGKYKQDLLTAEGGPNPDTWQQQIEGHANQLLQQSSAAMKTPEAKARLQIAAQPWLRETTIHAGADAFKFKVSKGQFTANTLLGQAMDEAGSAVNDREYQNALAKGMAITSSMQQSTMWGGDEAAAKRQTFLAGAEKAYALKIFQDPNRRDGLVYDLLNDNFNKNVFGGMVYHGMGPAEKKELGTSLQSKLEQERKNEEAAAEKEHKKFVEDSVGELWQRAKDKTISPDELKKQGTELRLNREDRAALASTLEKKPDDLPSDKATKFRVLTGITQDVPSITANEIMSLHSQGLLNDADSELALKQLKSAREHLQNQAQAAANRAESAATRAMNRQIQQYNSDVALLKTKFGLVSPFDKLEQNTQKQYIEAYTNLHDRAYPLGNGKEKSSAIIDDIIKRGQSGLDEGMKLDEKQLQGLIKFDSKAALDAARQNKTISDAEYKIQEGYVLRMAELKRQKEATAAQMDERKRQQAEYDKQAFYTRWFGLGLPNPGVKNRPTERGGGGGGGKFPAEPRR